MVLTLLSSLLVMVSVRAVCSAQSCLRSMVTVFCVPCMNQVVVVTGTVYLQVLHWWPHNFGTTSWWFVKMLEICEEFACSHHVRFNPAKTQLIWGGLTVNFSSSAPFNFVVSAGLSGSLRLLPVNEFIWRSWHSDEVYRLTVSLRFNFANNILKTHLFQSLSRFL